MADLTFMEKRKLELLLKMGDGYVLDFSNRTLAEFVADSVGRDIYAQAYDGQGSSKANRIRCFWKVESNQVVGKLVADLLAYCRPSASNADDMKLFTECSAIASKLQGSSRVENVEVIAAEGAEPAFELLARAVRDAIENNQPEAGLDRLHTFVTKLLRHLAQARGVAVTREKPLHSIFGEYVKSLRTAGLIESEMTERILKSSISVLESFSHVRNEASLAHDNATLGYDESLLIFNHICSSIRFLKALESRRPAANAPDDEELGDDLPF